MRLSFLSLIAAMSLAWPMPAFAHVTANPNTGEAGQYFETKFRVSHGCDGSDTVEVHIRLPQGMVIAKPQAKPGWKIEVKKSKLDQPVPAGHGKMADEQIDEIIWRGGRLADSQYDEFGVILKLPAAETEHNLWFPVTQICKNGALEWRDIPADGQQWHEVEHPAPFVKVTPAASPKHHH